MKYAIFAGLLAFAGVNAGSTSHVESKEVENLGRVPQGWKDVGAPAQDKRLQFRIAVYSVGNLLTTIYLCCYCIPGYTYNDAY
jgi:tripeptidyl-peptidase-1